MYKVIFVGLPNVGKSSLINSISNSALKIGNWPGTTYEKKEVNDFINDKAFKFTDLPGTYTIESLKKDEAINLKYILSEKIDLIVNVVDSSDLQKNLKLSTQLKIFGIKMIMVLNFEDEFKKFKFSIDKNKLEEIFELDVIFTSTKTGNGIKELKELIYKSVNEKIRSKNDFLKKVFTSETNEYTSNYCALPVKKIKNKKCFYRLKKQIDDFVKKSLLKCKYSFKKEEQLNKTKKIDDILLNKYLSPIFAVIILTFVFAITFSLANPFINLIDNLFNSFLAKYLNIFLNYTQAPEILKSFLINGLLSAIGLTMSFTPLIFLLNFSLSLLQSTGYISRVAFIFERLVSRFGISGRSIFPLLLGFGCNVPTVYALKSIKNPNEQKLNLFILGFISCGARLPIYGIFSLAFFPDNVFLMIISMYILGFVFAMLVGFLLKHKFKKLSFNIIEMPLYRIPSLKNIIKMSWFKTKMYTKRIKLIIKVVLILWVFSNFPQSGENSFLGKTAKFISPVFKPLGFGERWEVIASLPAAIIAKEGALVSMQIFLNTKENDKKFSYQPLKDFEKIFTTFFKEIIYNSTKDIFSFFKIDRKNIKSTYGTSIVNKISNLFSNFALLKAVSFMIFILLTVPCIVVLNAIKTTFSFKTMTKVALSYFLVSYFASLIFYQTAMLFVN